MFLVGAFFNIFHVKASAVDVLRACEQCVFFLCMLLCVQGVGSGPRTSKLAFHVLVL